MEMGGARVACVCSGVRLRERLGERLVGGWCALGGCLGSRGVGDRGTGERAGAEQWGVVKEGSTVAGAPRVVAGVALTSRSVNKSRLDGSFHSRDARDARDART